MLQEKIKYVDYDGVEHEEVFFFNLNQAEITEMELSTDGGLAKKIETVTSKNDGAEIVKIFKDIILKAYGEKSPDGKRFVKSEELSIAFSQTEAYNNLFMSLCTNPEKAAAFMNGIVPSGPNK